MACNRFILLLLAAGLAYSALPTADTVTNSFGMGFTRIPAGTFQMGFEGWDTLKDDYVISGMAGTQMKFGIFNEHPRHSVTLSRDFYMGTSEVTVAQYCRFNPGIFTRMGWTVHDTTSTCAVKQVTWKEADSFCNWLTAHDPNGYCYRLPTEAEWEYCCRAGTVTHYYTGDTISWGWLYHDEAHNNIGSVRQSPPNPWGLYGMLDNVEEWCLDWYGPYRSGPQTNPGGYASGDFRVTRGSGWHSAVWEWLFWVRSSYRAAWFEDDSRGANNQFDWFWSPHNPDGIGFRIVMSELTKDSLAYLPLPDTQYSWQRNVSPYRPAPLTAVTGGAWTDSDGRVFQSVNLKRFGRVPWISQRDTLVYVCADPLMGDSSATRRLAGLYARSLAERYGVLYRIANRSELSAAGVTAEAGKYYLTIIPDLKYSASQPHPDVAYHKVSSPGAIPWGSTGPLYRDWFLGGSVAELPNGDLLATILDQLQENNPTDNIACARLHYGDTVWGDLGSGPALWIPGRAIGAGFSSVGNKVILNCSQGYFKVSDDMGVHFSDATNDSAMPSDLSCGSGDTLYYVDNNGRMVYSADCGRTWVTRGAEHGIEVAYATADDSTVLVFPRGSGQNGAMLLHSTRDLGLTWKSVECPLTINDVCCNHPASIKLASGRILVYALQQTNDYGVLGETVDSGKTWFCRYTHYESRGYASLYQTRDGIIYGNGDPDRSAGTPVITAFSEQWLREQACRDIAEWGIQTAGNAGMISDCADTDPAYLSPMTVAANPDWTAAEAEVAPALTVSPNPFNPVTGIRFSLPHGKSGTLIIINIKGERVFTARLSRAQGQIMWDGKEYPSGLYLARLSAGGGLVKTAELLLIK